MISMVLLLAVCSRRPSGPVTHIAVTMRKFAVEPRVIRVRRGENVILDVSTVDVLHGFQVDQLGINEPVQPGHPAHIPLDTSKKGDFKVACSIVCGPGHNDMTGEIVIE
jgi:cytochrome c oxidase subunit 2